MEFKICPKCGEEKELSEFNIKKSLKSGHSAECKKCEQMSRKIYFQNNKKMLLEKKQKWRKENPEKYKEQTHKYYEKTKESQLQKKKVWIENNREKYNSYWVNRKKDDPSFSLLCGMRTRLWGYLKKKNITKRNKTLDIVGCTPELLKEHIEKQFVDGMTWGNRGKWHIDHIMPLSSAETEEELYALFHYTNLQPLWAEDNIKKRDKILEQINS